MLDTGELDAVLSLGITRFGIPSTEGANSIPSYLAGDVKDAKTVGTIQELNLEAIAALKPDLIIGSQLRADKLYPHSADRTDGLLDPPGLPMEGKLPAGRVRAG